jgi:hypothetical protein
MVAQSAQARESGQVLDGLGNQFLPRTCSSLERPSGWMAAGIAIFVGIRHYPEKAWSLRTIAACLQEIPFQILRPSGEHEGLSGTFEVSCQVTVVDRASWCPTASSRRVQGGGAIESVINGRMLEIRPAFHRTAVSDYASCNQYLTASEH